MQGGYRFHDKQDGVTAEYVRHGASRWMLVACVAAATLVAGCANQSGSRAPVTDLSGSSASSAATYTVKAGDTLNKIARSTGVSEATITRLNKITNPNLLVVGQVLRLSDGGAAAPKPGSAGMSRPAPQASATTSSESSPPPRAADAGIINWGWPAKGKVIQGFTPATKGIDIAGAAGDAIEAAAGGKVMYAGNGVRGLGNLVIIEHSDGFITAYAHNRTLLVKAGQEVKKGFKIAEMGQTDTTSVRLHFEVRRQGTPVDPLQYLPTR
jgi:lipoprotein NlpD